MTTFRFVAILGKFATYSTQFLFPLAKTFRHFWQGAAQPILLQQSAPYADFAARRPSPTSWLLKSSSTALLLVLALGGAAANAQDAGSSSGAEVAASSTDDPVAQVLRQRLQAWSQKNSSDAKAVFSGADQDQGRAASQSLSQAQTQNESAQAGPAPLQNEDGSASDEDELGQVQLSAPAGNDAPAPEPADEAQGANQQDEVVAAPNAVEAQSLTGDRELDAMLSDAQKLLLVQAIQTLQVLQKEDEQARAVAATLTDRQKTALLGLLRTLEEVQADQAEGQRGFSPEQREAIVEVLSTLESEQQAIERARAQQQRAADQQARAPQRQAQPGQAQPGTTPRQGTGQTAQNSASSGLAQGLLTPEQEAALTAGLAKLRAAEAVQAQGGDAQAALDMSAEERQALLAVIQIIQRLQNELGANANVAELSGAQKQELVAAVTRLQTAQQRRAAGLTSALAAAGDQATSAPAPGGTQTAARGPLNGGLNVIADDRREVNADLATANHLAGSVTAGRNSVILSTILRSSGQLETGLTYRSGTISAPNWELDYGVNVVGTLRNIAEQIAPLDSYKIAPDITVVRRLTDRINLKVTGQAEFVPNAGAMLATAGLIYSQGIYEAVGNVSAKYEYLANPDLPASNPLAEIDATTFGLDLGVAATGYEMGPTETDATAKLTLSQVLGQDPTVTASAKVVTKLTSDLSLTERIAKARADYIEQAGASLASAAFGPRRQPNKAALFFDDIFSAEGQSQARQVSNPAAPVWPSFDDIFAPEGAQHAKAAGPSVDAIAALVPVDPGALPYDLREATGRNFISQLTRLGYSEQKSVEVSLDRSANGLVTGRLKANAPHILSPSLVGEARLAYAGQFVPTTVFGTADPMFLQELNARLMAAWQAGERTTLAGRVSASLDTDFAVSSTGLMLEATRTLAPYADTSLKFTNTNTYQQGIYQESLNELRASLRYRDDRYGEFSGSVGRQFDQDFHPGAYVAAAAYAKGVANILSSGRDALFEAGLELRYDPQTDSEAEVGAFVKATIELN